MMSDDRSGPKAGDVWHYPYLWARQADAAEDGGRKNRPCVLAFHVRQEDGRNRILLLAITSRKPHADTPALPVPEIERRRANLDRDLPLWIILNERNEDFPQESYYFESGARIGRFSPSFLKKVQAEKIRVLKARMLRRVLRRD